MAKTANKLLIICFLTSFVLSQSCTAPNPALDQIDSGRVVVLKRGAAREHCYTIGVAYPMPVTGKNPDIAISTSRISGYNTAGGFDYSVTAGRQGTSNNIGINLQINEDNKWMSIQISYLVSSNSNLIIGNFIGNMFPLTSCSGITTQTASIQTYVPTWRINSTLDYSVSAFISGFRTSDNSFSVQIVKGDIDKVDGRIVIVISSNANPGLQYIFVSYVVYPNSPAKDLNFISSIVNQNQQSTYRLQGTVNFQQNTVFAYNQFIICRNGTTVSCKPNQVLVNQKCQCNRGFVRVGENCRQICTLNGYLNQNRQCLCLPGFQFNQMGVCIAQPTCSVNETSSNGTCVCRQGFYRASRSSCLPFCVGQNQVWNGATCLCSPGFFRAPNGFCVRQINCNQNEIQQGNQCICAPGFTRNQRNVCAIPIQCRRNQVNVRGVCQCAPGFTRNRGGNCRAIQGNCQRNQVFNQQTGECDCAPNFIRNGLNCIQLRCPANQQLVNGRCICIQGWARIRNICRPCPPGATSNNDRTNCICPANSIVVSADEFGCISCPANSFVQNNSCSCNPGFMWNAARTACVRNIVCPANSSPSPDGTSCTCNQGFQWNQQATGCIVVSQPVVCPPNSFVNNRGACQCNPGFSFTQDRRSCVSTITCPANGFVGPLGTCVCNNGFYFQDGQCKQVPKCPQNSFWSREQLKCLCSIPGQFLINNACQACPNNQNWNNKECVCNRGLFRIQGVCRACDINTTYNGTDCQCNIGFYGNRDKCLNCHASCGRCSGPESSQCITCPDISYSFSKGYCIKENPCPVGNWLNGSTCARCSDYCQICVNQDECGQCAEGFELDLLFTDDGTALAYCKSVCGDGRRVDAQKCDDGNKANGDGCNSECQVQKQWTCLGGTAVRPSTCTRQTPTRSIIQVKGTVNLLGKVIQGVRLSFVPKCFTDKQCIDCYKILSAQVIQGNIPVLPKVMYVPNSEGQFIIQYDFGSLITITFFKYKIQINKNLSAEYRNCFTPEDYAQQIINTVDTALLAKNEQASELSLDTINSPQTPNINNSARNQQSSLPANFGVGLPYPKSVIDKLGLLFTS